MKPYNKVSRAYRSAHAGDLATITKVSLYPGMKPVDHVQCGGLLVSVTLVTCPLVLLVMVMNIWQRFAIMSWSVKGLEFRMILKEEITKRLELGAVITTISSKCRPLLLVCSEKITMANDEGSKCSYNVSVRLHSTVGHKAQYPPYYSCLRDKRKSGVGRCSSLSPAPANQALCNGDSSHLCPIPPLYNHAHSTNKALPLFAWAILP